jgi:dihydrofolate synthase/folylpolyglutamate synthase
VAYLASLEPFGWRFGLDRIRLLTAALGNPQHRFASIHVVGTNGKSSVTSMTARLLEAQGINTGSYLSPHEERWSQRIEVGGTELDPEAFGAAVERVAQAVEPVNRSLEEGDSVTEFEVVTAAAFVALANARVEVGVIEAGLGGRLDATNVIPSRVTALTSVGLEHTSWLGDTTAEIATEKLAVLREHSTLVVGRLDPEIDALAERTAVERHARLVRAEEGDQDLGIEAPYLRRNFRVAAAAATEIAGALDAEKVEAVRRSLDLRGRMEELEESSPMILDAAHNPDGAAALAEALAAREGDRPVVACVAILEDKDATGILAALAPALDAIVCTEVPADRLAHVGRAGARTVAAKEVAALVPAGLTAEVQQDPVRAIQRARELAVGLDGVVLVTGSHYLLGYAAPRDE